MTPGDWAALLEKAKRRADRCRWNTNCPTHWEDMVAALIDELKELQRHRDGTLNEPPSGLEGDPSGD